MVEITKKQIRKSISTKLSNAKAKAKKESKRAVNARYRANKLQESLSKIDAALSGHGKEPISEEELLALPEKVRNHVAENEVVFKANDGPQAEFLESPERDVLYGGAAGGGKSYALLADVLRDVGNPNHRGLLLRRTLPELTELIDKSRQLYAKAMPGAVFKQAKSTWEFPSGAKIWFSYVDDDRDVTRYQGQAFNWIGIDEITQYPTPYVWNYLRSRLRSTDSQLGLYMRCTANPGGVGGWWVKKMYIDPSPPNAAFWAKEFDTQKTIRYPIGHIKEGQPLFLKKFIPARLTDNPYLMITGEYEAMLYSLPEVERRRLLEGDWDVAEGAAFSEFNREVHVVDPFEVPEGWARIRAGDYGYSSPSCILWGAVDWDGNLWIYRELYIKGYTGEALAQLIREMDRKDTRMSLSVLDKSCWNRTGLGPSIAETMIRQGVRWIPSDSNRMSGKIEVHRRLAMNDYGEPRLRIFSTCTNLVRTLPTIPLSKTNSEDVDTKADDHAYDALRYMCMTRQVSTPQAAIFRNMHHRPPELTDATFGY